MLCITSTFGLNGGCPYDTRGLSRNPGCPPGVRQEDVQDFSLHCSKLWGGCKGALDSGISQKPQRLSDLDSAWSIGLLVKVCGIKRNVTHAAGTACIDHHVWCQGCLHLNVYCLGLSNGYLLGLAFMYRAAKISTGILQTHKPWYLNAPMSCRIPITNGDLRRSTLGSFISLKS